MVVDTNTLVSGNINRQGPSARIVDMLNNGALQLLYDGRILREYDAVLRRPRFRLPAAVVDALLENISGHGELITAVALDILLPDATDLPFLEVAVSGHAECLVTGNGKHYKPIRGEHTAEVVSPRGFTDRLPE